MGTKSCWFVACAVWVGSSVAFAAPWRIPPAAAETKSPFTSESSVIDAGRKLYADRCADCHGDKGKGNGPGGSDLEKQPTSFIDGTFQKQTDGEIFWKITEGNRPMPSYKHKLSEEQRWQLVHFLRTFRK